MLSIDAVYEIYKFLYSYRNVSFSNSTMYFYTSSGCNVRMSSTGIVLYSGSLDKYPESMYQFLTELSHCMRNPSVIRSLGKSRKIIQDVWVRGATTTKRMNDLSKKR
jgi:hypothetical protein